MRLEYMSKKGFFEAWKSLNFFLYAVRIQNMQNKIILCIYFYLNIYFVHKSHILRFKKAFLAHILESHMLILLIYGQKIIIFIFIHIYKWGKESLIFKKSPKWCPGGITITYNILSRFRYAKIVET